MASGFFGIWHKLERGKCLYQSREAGAGALAYFFALLVL
jgi:hypothetical protein